MLAARGSQQSDRWEGLDWTRTSIEAIIAEELLAIVYTLAHQFEKAISIYRSTCQIGECTHARKTERQRQRAATDSARESGEISERMDGIGLEGVKPIPGMSVGPEGRKEGRRRSEDWLS
jgi:hypothetical protein